MLEPVSGKGLKKSSTGSLKKKVASQLMDPCSVT